MVTTTLELPLPASASAAARARGPQASALATQPEAPAALREAIWRLERSLRQRLVIVDRGLQDGATGSAAVERAREQRARLTALRRAARRLGAEGADLFRKAVALEPLLDEVERREVERRGVERPEGAGALDHTVSAWSAQAPGMRIEATTGATCGEATDVGEGRVFVEVGASGARPEIWLRHRAAKTGMFLVSTAGSDFDTVVEVYESCPTPGARPLATGDDEIGLQARAALAVAAGEISWIRVGGWEGARGGAVVALEGGVAGFAGTITREDTGQPLGSREVAVWASTGSYLGETESDSSGVYVFAGLDPGSYFATTRPSYWSNDLLDELYDDLPCPGGAPQGCNPTTGTPIAVTAGVIRTDIDFALGPGGQVTGRVRDAVTGAGLVDAAVELFGPSGNFIDDTVTDVAGRYTVSGLGPGTVYALAAGDYGPEYGRELYRDIPCRPSSCNVTTGTPISVAVGQTTPGIDFSLEKLGAIAGTVTRVQDGSPVTYAEVKIWDSQGASWGYDYTDGVGQYVAGGLDPGTYFVGTDTFGDLLDELYDNLPCEPSCTPTTGNAVTVTRANTTTGIDFALRRMGSISGTVTDAGTAAPIDYAYVSIFDSAGTYVASGSGYSGTYTVSGLPAGTYYVHATADLYRSELYNDVPCPGGPPSGCSFSAGTLVSVQLNTTTSGINFALTRLGAISGTVTDQTTGAPLNDGFVQVWNAAGQSVGYQYVYAGAYKIEGLTAGTYFVTAVHSEYLPELYNGLPCPGGGPPSCNPASGTPVSVSLGMTRTGVSFTLVRKGAIAGTVRDAPTGAPIEYADVSVYNASGVWVATTYTGSTGTYEVKGLDGGNHFVVARANGHGGRLYNGLPCPGGSCNVTSGNPVPVTLGATTAGIDFSLPRHGTITGLVSSDGTPLSFVSVALYSANGNSQGYTYTGSDGRYQLSVEAGTWFLVAGAWSDYGPELYNDIPCPGGSCNVTTGTPVYVVASGTTSGIDFRLGPGRGILGCVVGETAQPLAGVAIDLWDTTGLRIASAVTGPGGCYRLTPSNAGTYFVSTDSGMGLVEEVWNNVPCPLGSAYAGRCDPSAGTPINMPSSSALLTGVDFTLDVGRIFRSGFEPGDSAWTLFPP
jgi:hypothetical protein